MKLKNIIQTASICAPLLHTDRNSTQLLTVQVPVPHLQTTRYSVALTFNLLYTACLFSIGLGENVLDGLVDGLDLVSLLVGDLDAELLLDGNDDLDSV